MRSQTLKERMAWLATASGAVAAGGQIAHGAIVVTTVNQFVGTNINGTLANFPSYTFDLPGTNDFNLLYSNNGFFKRVQFQRVAGATYVGMKNASTGTSTRGFAYTFGKGPGVATGQTWNQITNAGGAINLGLLAGNNGDHAVVARDGSSGFVYGTFNDTNLYYGFTFKDTTAGGALRYGYIQLDRFDGNASNGTGVDMQAYIHSYGYDTTGAKIAMGAAASAFPEPSSPVLVMSCLVMGACFIRRRKQIPVQPVA